MDAVVERVGDAGLYTAARHRRRGLATITTAAAIEHGLAHGLAVVNWTCAEDNIGSIKIAERVGLTHTGECPGYFLQVPGE